MSSSGRRYPRVAGRTRLTPGQIKQAGRVCGVCGKAALWKVDVQVSWFRGEDEEGYRCDEHLQIGEEKRK